MANVAMTLACGAYDRTSAVVHGLVKPQDIDLRVREMDNIPAMFTGMYRGEYDASEMSMAELAYYTSRGQADFIGIPVFLSRRFRHGMIFTNPASHIEVPEDLEGTRVGFPRMTQSACVWIRGILTEEYHVAPQKTHWHYGPVHHWGGDIDRDEIKPHDGSTLHWLDIRAENEEENAELALVQGEIDALGMASPPSGLMTGDRRIKRLFENHREVEIAYFKKTGIFPIMHTLTVRKSLVEQHPDLPEQLFHLFSQSKKLGREWVRKGLSLSMAWTNQYLDEEQVIFQGDAWSYGLEGNTHTVDTFLSYCYDQGVSARRMTAKELFAPSTWELTE